MRTAWRKAGERGKPARQAWASVRRNRARARAEFERRIRGELPGERLAAAVRTVKDKLAAAPKEIATRAASELALEALVPAIRSSSAAPPTSPAPTTPSPRHRGARYQQFRRALSYITACASTPWRRP